MGCILMSWYFADDLQVFVSPWGWGEWSHKDFEAMISGCIVVKPEPSSYEMFPALQEDGVSVLGVKADFSDLEEKVVALLHDMAAATKLAERASERLRTASDPSVYARGIGDAWLQILQANLESERTAIARLEK